MLKINDIGSKRPTEEEEELELAPTTSEKKIYKRCKVYIDDMVERKILEILQKNKENERDGSRREEKFVARNANMVLPDYFTGNYIELLDRVARPAPSGRFIVDNNIQKIKYDVTFNGKYYYHVNKNQATARRELARNVIKDNYVIPRRFSDNSN